MKLVLQKPYNRKPVLEECHGGNRSIQVQCQCLYQEKAVTPAEARGILGLSAAAGIEDVQRAYKQRSQFMHPDRFAGRPEGELRFATAEFQRLANARDLLRDVLSDSSRRWDDPDDRDWGPSKGPEAPEEPAATCMSVVIPHSQAAAGSVILIQTPAGEEVRVRLPRLPRSGTTVRVRHRGDILASDGTRNDLLISFQLAPDEHPSNERNASVPPHVNNHAGNGAAHGYGYGNAKIGLGGKSSLGFAVLIVLSIILIVSVVAGIPASSESPEAMHGPSIEFVLEPDSGSMCPSEMSGCWTWTITPEESCNYAVVTIELSHSETGGGSRTKELYGYELTAGLQENVLLSAEGVEENFASISDITCQGA